MRFSSLVCVILFVAAGGLAFGQQSSSAQSGSSGTNAITPGSTITLDQAIKIALDSSLSNELSTINLDIAKAANAITRGQNGISLAPSASYTHTAPYGTASQATSSSSLAANNPVDNFGAGLKATLGSAGSPTTSLTIQGNHEVASTNPVYQVTQLNATLAQTIWDGYLGGTGWLTNNIADISLEQKLLARQSDRNSLIYQVRQAYYALASAQDSVALNKQIIVQSDRDYQQTKTLYDAGQDTAVDLMQADVNRQTAELNLADAENGVTNARRALSSLIGVPLATTYSVQSPAPASVPSQPVNDLVNTALGHRLDLQQLVLGRQAAALTTDLDAAGGSPVVSASAGVTYSHDWNAKTNSGTWNAGVQVSVPLSISGTIAAQVQQAKLQEQSYQVQISQLQQSIAQNVQQDYDSVASLEKHVKLAQQSLDLAQKQYQLVQIQFRQGTKAQLDVLTDSVAVGQAATALETAKTNLQLAILKLKNDMGD
ncbi:MAG TPA: TolC family protein [Spirochaetia bacterium]|nr:TolC family protein [Spirochaetia bacterium]